MNKTQFWLTLLILFALAVGCSSGDIPAEFLEDRKHLVQTFSAFDQANKVSQVPEGVASYKPSPGIEEKVQALIEKGLKEGEAISDEFLDWLHPEMRMFFRGKYMWGHRLIFEGRKEDNVKKRATGIQLVQEWYHYFWEKNVDAIYKKAYPKG
jgi:hypothetical protein